MKLESILSTVVVIAEMHNPTILHPSFLINEQIIPNNWHPVGNILCTPGFSTAAFNSNYSFFVDHNRLEIKNRISSHKIEDSEVADIAAKYIKKLEHTKYLAVGINFIFFVSHENPDKYIINTYLKNNFPQSADNFRKTKLEFEIEIEGYLMNLKFGSGEKPSKKNEEKGIIIASNTHKDLTSNNKIEELLNILSGYRDLSIKSQKVINDYFLCMGDKK